MPELTLSEQLAILAADSRRNHVPAEVEASVAQRVLDVLGLCVAALDLPTSRGILDYVASQGGAKQAQAVGLRTSLPASLAALANGVLAHSLDYDDTHLPSVMHPSASVVPAALAAGQACGSTGREVSAAVAVGLEVAVRVGMAGYDASSRTSVFFDHGQHATSICGTMGGSVAAGMLYGLNEAGLRDVLGIAASMASGIIEANRSGGTVKRLHCGWAAQSAVTAAQLVLRGFSGPPSVLEGRFGFFEAFLHATGDTDAVTNGLGTTWAVPSIFFKPYPANHFTHAVIDAGIELRKRGLNVSQVERFVVRVPSAVVRTIGEPLERKQAPRTGYEAQFSGPYALVAALLGGSGLGVGRSDFADEVATSPERRDLMARVEVIGDPRCDAIFPEQFPAIVEASTRDGQLLRAEVLTNRGGPDRPLTESELALKFNENVQGRLDNIDAVSQCALGLGTLPNLQALMQPLAHTSTQQEKPGVSPELGKSASATHLEEQA